MGYKTELIQEIKNYIEITAYEMCKNCDNCCEQNNCKLTQISNGLSNVFGINFFGGSNEK